MSMKLYKNDDAEEVIGKSPKMLQGPNSNKKISKAGACTQKLGIS
jgi:hypothetical protein